MAAGRKEEAIRYFGQKGFQRALTQIWKKYRSLGRAGGHAKLEALTREECDAIGGFMGIGLKPGERYSLSLARFEQELAGTPFPCSTIPELHLLLTGEPLLSDEEAGRQKQDEWSAVFIPSSLLLKEASANACWIREWLTRLQHGETPGYRTLRELCRDESEQAAASRLREVVQALLELEAGVPGMERGFPEDLGPLRLDRVRLPVLAARVTGDSHAFDLKRPAGRLLWLSLRERAVRQGPNTEWSDATDDDVPNEYDTQAIRDVYRACGIGDDDLSSLVYIYVPDLTGEVQPAVLTLRQVEQLPAETLVFSQVFAVENPSVFSTLLDVTAKVRRKMTAVRQPSARPPVLICTSGQPSLASLLYIKGCLEASGEACRLRYSGDFDAKGIEMAIQLARRFQDKFEPWRFNTVTYEQYADRGPLLNETDEDWLTRSPVPWDVALAPAMVAAGRKCFQETFIMELVQDWVDVLMNHWKNEKDSFTSLY